MPGVADAPVVDGGEGFEEGPFFLLGTFVSVIIGIVKGRGEGEKGKENSQH